jgi:4-amino-4-deoxy-L-arabinose transferase-like glycosyltransferase
VRAFDEAIVDAALLALFAALVYVVLFWQLGVPSFWNPDEAHYAETTREMLASGDWWAPYFNERPFFDKPALFHQLQGIAMLALGPTELAARMVPALAALGLVLITGWFGAVTRSRDAGIVAALLLIANPGVFGLARYAILDTLFTLFLFGGAALITVAAVYDRPRLQWPGYVCIAVAVMVKGPLGFVLCGLALIAAITASRHLRQRLLGLRWLSGLALAVLLASPWFVYMFWRFGDDFVQGYVLDENLRLYSASRFANQPNFTFYLRILAAGLLPWTGLLIGRLYDDVRALIARRTADPIETLLWIWIAVIVGFFSVSTFKLDHYVFPAAPALCLLGARAWIDLRNAPASADHAGARLGLRLIGPIVLAIGLACGYMLLTRLDLPRLTIIVPAALTIAGAVVTTRITIRGARPARAPWMVLTALLVTYVGLVAFVVPALDRRKVLDDMGRWVAERRQQDTVVARVASYRLPNSAFRFYADQHVTLIDHPEDARAFFSAPEPFYCLMRRAAFDELVAGGMPLRVAYEREGVAATSGRALLRGSTPGTRFVLATQDSQAKSQN